METLLVPGADSMAVVAGMRILVACEFSGAVRDAFAALVDDDGRPVHEVVSCDLIPTTAPPALPNASHYAGDIFDILGDGWDLMVAHPECTHLAVSGARWFPEKRRDGRQQAAIAFFMEMVSADVPRIAIENPVGIMSSIWRKPDQIIQPWWFGHGETKGTCLWLKNLPKLEPTEIVDGRDPRIWRMPPSEDRGRLRSITYPGIARAMAGQWGRLPPL